MEALKDARAWLARQSQLRAPKTGSRREGKGFALLFDGPPSSSAAKRATAETLAQEAGKELYVVDLSAVVSKYIGETEKNLAAVFRQAVDKDAVLFFDEADALFGKRTGIRDAHDQYANVETGYLLQRLQAHPGLVILAANGKGAIDPAFLRRFQTVVRFPRVRPLIRR